MKTAEDHGHSFEILNAVEAVNEKQKKYMVEKIVAHFDKDLKGKHFAIWGLSFKPRTDDMREAPSLTIIQNLLDRGATVSATDPEAIEETKRILGDKIEYVKRPMDALDGADALVLVTEWSEFRNPDFRAMKEKMRGKVIFDGRNIYSPSKVRAQGFTYYGVGVDKG